MRNRKRSLALWVALMVLVAVSCGSESVVGDEDRESPSSARWADQVLPGRPGPDQPTLLASDGDELVVVLTGEDGTITGYAGSDGDRLVRGTPAVTGVTYLRLGGVARLDDRWITLGTGGREEVDGDGRLLFDAHAFSSTDGRTWTEVATSGIDEPADVHAVVSAEGSVVAVGALREAPDPADGGFRAVAWHSDDGASWTRVALPGAERGEGYVSDVLVTRDRLLAVGSVAGRGSMWSSEDRGRTWEVSRPKGIPSGATMDSLELVDDVIVASAVTAGDEATEGSPILLRSDDHGTTWRPAATPPPGAGAEPAPHVLAAGGGRFFATVSSFREAFREPELCYADIELCRADNSVALYASDDGDHWDRIDTSGLGAGEASEVDAVLGVEDGRVVVLHQTGRGLAVAVWPAQTELPTTEEPVDPTSAVVVLGDDEEAEVGTTYAVPLYIHCGMDWLYLGGEPWQRTDGGPDAETGAGDEIPADWPVAQQTIFGFATRVSEDEVEYSIGDGEVIATYAPAVDTPPGCL